MTIQQMMLSTKSVVEIALSSRTVFKATPAPDGTARAGIHFLNNGVLQAVTGDGVVGDSFFDVPGEWAQPQGIVGSQYEVLATLLSGSTPSGVFGTRLSLGTNRVWLTSRQGTGSSTSLIRFSIYLAGGTTPLATADITLDTIVGII